MQIIFRKNTKNYQLIVAETTSSEEILFKKIKDEISDNELVKFKEIKNKKRKLEWLSVRVLMKILLGEYEEILYHETGKPYLKNKHISISHSRGKIAIIVSKFPNTAIDIELINEKILNLARKFMFENQINKFDDKQKLHFITANWSVKETIFKSYSKGNVDFKNDIFLKNTKIKKKGKIKSSFKYKKIKQKFKINYKILKFTDPKEKYFLSWYIGNKLKK